MPQTLTFCLMESNARDAATLSLYADVGSLFYTVGKAYGNAQFVGYLGTTLLPALSWPPTAIAQLVQLQQLVDGGTNLSDFRDKFKSLMKAFKASA
jgi:hypothetical protein